MHRHWERLESILGKKIKRVKHSVDLVQLCEDMQMLPNFRMRWCTRILKIEPTIAYMESLPVGSTLYVGLRADEEERRGIFGEDVTIRFPLRELGWREADVLSYLEKLQVLIPTRTDCALCPYQRLEEWKSLWENHKDKWAQGEALEKKIGHTFRSPQRDAWPASMAGLAREFANGRVLRKSSRPKPCRVCSL